MDEFREGASKFFTIFAEVLAILTILLYIVFVVNANWEFITDSTILNILSLARYYAPLLLVSIIAIEFAVKHSIFIQIIIYLLIAVVVIFQFFPGTWDSIMNVFGA